MGVLASALSSNVKMFKFRENRHMAQFTAENVSSVVTSLDVEDFDCLIRNEVPLVGGLRTYDATTKKVFFDTSNQSWLSDWIQAPVTDVKFDISLVDADTNAPISNHPNLGAVAKHHRVVTTSVTYKKNPQSSLDSTFVTTTRLPPLDRINGERQNSWRAMRSPCYTPTNVPTARGGIFTVVWTGTEAIIWGGKSPGYLNTGGRYNPKTDTWTATSTIGAPSAREEHFAAWTGTEMLIWGGIENGGAWGTSVNNGALYNPNTDTWRPMTNINAPGARCCIGAVWNANDSKAFFWGGRTVPGTIPYNNGGIYDLNPVASGGTWTPVPAAPIPAVHNSSAVWTGSHYIVWGGDLAGINLANTGAIYNPALNSWQQTSPLNVPIARDDHVLVWDQNQQQMIAWGGLIIGGATNTGGRFGFDPSAAVNADGTFGQWILPAPPTTTASGAPSARRAMSANSQMGGIWTGRNLFIWGGHNNISMLSDGGWYSPATNEWNRTFSPFTGLWSAGQPMATRRRLTTAAAYSVGVWTGSEVFIFGGITSWAGPQYTNQYGNFAP